jgi:DNA-nicking Smr family endonuclease
MRRRPPPNDAVDDDPDDATLFREAVGPVRRLPASPDAPARPRPKPRARMGERDEADARDTFRRALDDPLLEAGDALSWRRDDVAPRVLRRLARGEFAVEDELDLHGADVLRAEALLRRFLQAAHDGGHGCVRVIHGKGLHARDDFDAAGAPVLKNLVDRLLRRRSDVLAFHSAPARGGGTGAVLVLLRTRA